jgi:hypothetical protein
MGKRETNLKEYLNRKYGSGKLKKPNRKIFEDSMYDTEIKTTYKKLSGKLSQYPIQFRGFDIVCNDFIIELDEERHFNRFRLITLDSSIYKDYINFDVDQYKKYCNIHESECLASAAWSKNWETKTSKEQFGKSDFEGCLKDNGSSRWKQRAFYDFLRDITSCIYEIPILRISIWDEIDGVTISELINCNDFEWINELIQNR